MTTHKEIVKALNDLGAKEWTLSSNEIADIVWLTDDKKTEAEIKAAIAKPLPDKELSLDDKLASVGLSVADLKAALGL
jgi:hypothetical protein